MPTRLLRSKQDYWTTLPGFGAVHVVRGELVPSDHPLVAANPEHYEDAKQSTRFEVEQATAAPGEKRVIGRARSVPGEGAATDRPA